MTDTAIDLRVGDKIHLRDRDGFEVLGQIVSGSSYASRYDSHDIETAEPGIRIDDEGYVQVRNIKHLGMVDEVNISLWRVDWVQPYGCRHAVDRRWYDTLADFAQAIAQYRDTREAA
jgi:hypothetical protein